MQLATEDKLIDPVEMSQTPMIPKKGKRHFIMAAMRNPFKIGSVVPSSRFLARAMASGADLSRPGIVLELGAGTGSVTNALLQMGIPKERLLVVERDDVLFDIITRNFPHAPIVKADAMKLDEVLEQRGIREVGTVVSSLPFLSMPKNIREAIQQQMEQAIGDHGVIVQFTYGPKSPISKSMLKKLGLRAQRKRTILNNVPPAHIWHYSKQL